VFALYARDIAFPGIGPLARTSAPMTAQEERFRFDTQLDAMW
jgi:hypothetical protein